MIAIIGAGAMGGWLASEFTQSGQEVVLVDVSAPLVEAITSRGITVRSKDGVRNVKMRAVTSPQGLPIADTVLFFVKATYMRAAAELAQPLVSPETTVVSLQNGWGNADVLAERYMQEQIIVGVTYHSATVINLADVAHTGTGVTIIGPYAEAVDLDRASAFGALLSGAGVENVVSEHVKTEIWGKLILNAATLPTAALTRLSAGDLFAMDEMKELVDDVAAEAVSVAQGLGYDISLGERLERIHAVLEAAGKGKASMLQDVESTRKTEVEVINGAIVKSAKSLGLKVPLNEAMVRLIHGLERSWTI